jgi:hypothetical protein
MAKEGDSQNPADIAALLKAKISNQQLRLMAELASGDDSSVLIEANIPAPLLDVEEVLIRGRRVSRIKDLIDLSPSQIGINDQIMAEGRDFLTHLTGRDPRVLTHADTFVTRLTGLQLRVVALSNLFLAIHPNRTVGEKAEGTTGQGIIARRNG